MRGLDLGTARGGATGLDLLDLLTEQLFLHLASLLLLLDLLGEGHRWSHRGEFLQGFLPHNHVIGHWGCRLRLLLLLHLRSVDYRGYAAVDGG